MISNLIVLCRRIRIAAFRHDVIANRLMVNNHKLYELSIIEAGWWTWLIHQAGYHSPLLVWTPAWPPKSSVQRALASARCWAQRVGLVAALRCWPRSVREGLCIFGLQGRCPRARVLPSRTTLLPQLCCLVGQGFATNGLRSIILSHVQITSESGVHRLIDIRRREASKYKL